MKGTNEKIENRSNVQITWNSTRTSHNLSFLVIILFIEAYGEWRILERASTQDDFAVPDGWEAVVFTMDNVTQHILNQVFKGTGA
jgi:hypothetical protein